MSVSVRGVARGRGRKLFAAGRLGAGRRAWLRVAVKGGRRRPRG